MSTANDLIHETSPYLLQHAYNPVQWYPWGEKALQLARQLDKPILVSIGYAACHWCHVMERESFENDHTAAYMNEHFINIKIDREERPDLDHIYMDAVQAISGSGGWPLNVFLTPEAKPFYGGTYFPPTAAFNRSSWLDVLASMHDHWTNNRQTVEEQAEQLTAHLSKSNNLFLESNLKLPTDHKDLFAAEKLQIIAANISKNADMLEGGYGNPPKFLQTGSIRFMIQYAYFSNDPAQAEHAFFSLRKMIRGGIYDQVGGGISRYSTDREWLVPHFEKMLYDNALLITSLCEAQAYRADAELENAIHRTIQFVQGELHNGSGGYYTALDADSEGVEGKYYVWTQQEINDLLGADAAPFSAFYQVTQTGNWEHHNILHVRDEVETVAAAFNIQPAVLQDLLERGRQRLLAHRQSRIAPGLDDKILLDNNALFITALCRAYACTGEKTYLPMAEKAFCFIEKFLKNAAGGLFHNYKNGQVGVSAFLDDYAYFIESLLSLQEATGDPVYLEKAKEYLEFVLANFSDEAGLLFHYSAKGQQDVIVRKTEVYDGAMPSSNAVMAKVLWQLSVYFNVPEWNERSAKMTASLSKAIENYPGSFSYWAMQYLGRFAGLAELAVVGEKATEFAAQILRLYTPNSVLQISRDADLTGFALLDHKPVTAETQIYLCENYACKAPVSTVPDLERLLENRKGFKQAPQ